MVDVAREPRAVTAVAGEAATRISIARPAVPAHVGTMLGLSVAGYGVALALVTGLQASSDAATQSARAPMATTIDRISAAHDRLEGSIGDAAAAFGSVASSYDMVGAGLRAVDDRLADLAAAVKEVDGASRALPARVALPPVVRSVRTAPIRTSTHATTGGSAAP